MHPTRLIYIHSLFILIDICCLPRLPHHTTRSQSCSPPPPPPLRPRCGVDLLFNSSPSQMISSLASMAAIVIVLVMMMMMMIIMIMMMPISHSCNKHFTIQPIFHNSTDSLAAAHFLDFFLSSPSQMDVEKMASTSSSCSSLTSLALISISLTIILTSIFCNRLQKVDVRLESSMHFKRASDFLQSMSSSLEMHLKKKLCFFYSLLGLDVIVVALMAIIMFSSCPCNSRMDVNFGNSRDLRGFVPSLLSLTSSQIDATRTICSSSLEIQVVVMIALTIMIKRCSCNAIESNLQASIDMQPAAHFLIHSSSVMELKKMVAMASSKFSLSTLLVIILTALTRGPMPSSSTRVYVGVGDFGDGAIDYLVFNASKSLETEVESNGSKTYYRTEEIDATRRLEMLKWMKKRGGDGEVEEHAMLYFPPHPSAHIIAPLKWSVSTAGLQHGTTLLSPWFIFSPPPHLKKQYIIFIFARFSGQQRRSNSIIMHVGKSKNVDAFEMGKNYKPTVINSLANGFAMIGLDFEEAELHLDITWKHKSTTETEKRLTPIYAFLDEAHVKISINNPNTNGQDSHETLPQGRVYWVVTEKGLYQYDPAVARLPWADENSPPLDTWHDSTTKRSTKKYMCPTENWIALS